MTPSIRPLPVKQTALLCALLSATWLISACDSSTSVDTADTSDSDNTEDSNNTDGTDNSTDNSDNGTDTSDATGNDPQDIYNAIFTARSADCGDYVNEYDANPIDIKNDLAFDADVLITASETECTFTSNSVPNHDFN
ncbi:MAG: hypothetical protein AAF404_04015, partial [Pseudomonadota bacterium]